jgi:hypothetical protein
MRRRGKRRCLDLLAVVVLVVLLPSPTWCIPHLGVNCVDHNSSSNRIGAIDQNSNCGNSNSNSHNNSSTVLLFHRHSRLPSCRHNNFLPTTFHASTAGRWVTLLENATCPSKATHRELRHPWSTSRWPIRRVLHHELAAPTTLPWSRFPREKKC